MKAKILNKFRANFFLVFFLNERASFFGKTPKNHPVWKELMDVQGLHWRAPRAAYGLRV